MPNLLFILLIVSFVNLCIGIYVLAYHPRRAVNQAFFIFTLGSSLWIGAFALLVTSHELFLIPIINFGGFLLVFGLTWFAQEFPKRKKLFLHTGLFWGPLFVTGILLIPSRHIVANVEFLLNGVMIIHHGKLVGLWSLVLLVYIILSLCFFIQGYKKSSHRDKERLRYTYAGISIFAVSAIFFDAILPGFFGITKFNSIGPLTSLIFISTTAYGIIRHEFLDIRLVIQRSFIYSFSFLMLLILYISLLLSLEKLSEGVTHAVAPVSAGIALLVGLLTFPYVEIWFKKVTDPFFFKDPYSHTEVLEELSSVLNTTVNFRALVEKCLAILERTFKPETCYFVRTDTNEYFSLTTNQQGKMSAKHVDAYMVEVVVCSGNTAIGNFVLGRKRSGDLYTTYDKSLLRTFGLQAMVAFQKAELFQKLREHTETLEQKVEERTKHLEELREQQRIFFDDLSHALQTPLTVLRSSIEVLQENPSLTRSEKIFHYMDSSIEDLSRIVRSMLHLARIETNTIESTRELFNVSEAVSRISEYVRIIADRQDITLEVNIEPDLILNGDVHQIEEAVTNVVSNSVKYTANCAVKIIEISVYAISNSLCIRVKDTGIGMTEEQCKRIGNRFYRTDHTARHEGTGLGFSIVDRIITQHGGLVAVQSTLGSGTEVLLKLPYISPRNLLHQKSL